MVECGEGQGFFVGPYFNEPYRRQNIIKLNFSANKDDESNEKAPVRNHTIGDRTGYMN